MVNAIQNGPPSEPHIRVARSLREEDVIITFNWDTLMDRALVETKPWTPDFGYGFSPRQVYRNGWKVPLGHPTGKAPRILKLHGSSNWITGVTIHRQDGVELTQAASSDTVWVFEYAETPYACYGGLFMPGYAPYSYGYYPPNIQDDKGKEAPEGHVFYRVDLKPPWRPEGTAPKEGLITMPLIIPPVLHKRYDLYGSLFKHLWGKAESALAEAEKIIIIGYSFPRTDLQTQALFTKAFVNRSTVPTVVVLNPDPDRVVNQIRYGFGIPPSNLLVVKECLSASFDLRRIGLGYE